MSWLFLLKLLSLVELVAMQSTAKIFVLTLLILACAALLWVAKAKNS